jgi:N-acetylneuraminic acid mutarotase
MRNEKQTGVCSKRAGAMARLSGLACGALLLAGLGSGVAHSQTAGEWTWIAGSSTEGSGQGQSGVYGTLLTPAAGNIPGGRNSASTWTDSSGNLWLFGGFGYASNANFGYLNDLWKFTPSTKLWAWVGGSNTLSGDYGSASATYGTLLTPAAGNVPGGRQSASSWVDKNGNLWLFGGQGEGAGASTGCTGGGFGELNDMWEFNPTASESSTNQWAWMAGGCTTNAPGTYPTQAGAPAASGLTPGGRYAAASWTDSNGNFWLFGGEGYDANGNFGELNDLWEFNPSTKLWAWMGGSSTIAEYSGQPGVYGTMGTSAAGNIPGGRYGAFSWTDSSGNFWLYGGDGFDALGNFVYLNDLWEFNPSTKQWAWVGGSSALTSYYGAWPAVYGTEGTPAAENLPGGRYNGSSWTGSSGHLWLFGGDGYGASTGFLNDLWEFNSPTSQWVWQSGNGTPFQSGIYGAQTPPATGTPGSRVQPASWTDSSGNLWLFGGSGRDSQGSQGELNDLWEYPPSSVSFGGTAAATPVFSVASGTYSTTQTVSIADATAGATIYYTTTASTSPPTAPTTPNSSSDSCTSPCGPISVSSTEVLEAIATAPGDSTSAVATAAYTITPQAATPTFSPVAGTYSTTQTVTISDATLGALVFYTTNGTTPTFTGTGPAKSPGPGTALYTVPIAVSSTETIEALATAYGYSTSAVASALYTIVSPPAATPTISPAAGTYTSAQKVTISDATTGATIYYTTDGSTPTTSSSAYSSAIAVSSTETINAIAVASGYATSAVGSALYTINIPAEVTDDETVTVTDTDTIRAYSAIAITPSSASFNASPSATAGIGLQYGPVTFTATGGTGNLTLTESGTVPPGLIFTIVNGFEGISVPPNSGVLAGPISSTLSPGVYTFSITATDAYGVQTTQTGYKLTVTTVPAPTVTSVSPNSGPAAGGTSVTITGSNFTSASTVSFGTTAAMNVSCSTTTSCTATSPPGTGTVNVTVTTPGGTSAITAADRFTYANPAPVISSLSPAVVSAGGSAFTLTVNGSGFTSSSTVYWGTTALALGTINIGGTRLTAQVTAADIATAGITNVTVQTPAPGGGTSNAFQFEVDSAASGTTTITTVTASVAPGSTASYPVTTPPAASNVTVTCLNLPPGATCSYNSATNSVTITTSATTPAGTYQITVVFTLTEPGSASGFILLPILLLPLVFLRRRLAARGVWATACLGLILLAGAAAAYIGMGCGGPGPTHQETSSGAVTLTVT